MPAIGRIAIRLVLALVAAWATSSSVRAEVTSSHELRATVLLDGDIQVVETIRLSGDSAYTNFSRSFWLNPAQDAWNLRQEIRNLRVRNDVGQDIAFRFRTYLDRANIDVPSIPDNRVIVLEYSIARPLVFSQNQVNWQWNLSGHLWRATISDVRIIVEYPGTPAPDEAILAYRVGYVGDLTRLNPVASDDSALQWTFNPNAPPEEPIVLSIDILRGDVQPLASSAYWADLYAQMRIPLLVLALLTLLAILLVFSPPSFAIRVTALHNSLPGLVALYFAISIASYWYFEQSQRSVGDDFSGEFIVNVGLAAFVLVFAVRQRAVLRARQRAAYFTQFALPAVLVIAWPISFAAPGLILYPLLGFPAYLYWSRKRIALEFGVGAFRIAEEVGTRGEVTVDALSEALKLPATTILHALEMNPHLPVVVAPNRRALWSADAAALHQETKVCTYCGGATEIQGMSVRECGYCSREFVATRQEKEEPPVPIVLESLATFFETLSTGGFVLAGTVALAIVVMEFIGGSVVDGLVGAAISGALFCIPPAIASGLAGALRNGAYVGFARFLLFLFGWLIVPLFVFSKLGSRRVRLFTGAMDIKPIEEKLRELGEWPLPAFAEFMQCNREDATELAQHLAVHQIIDAVYDRRGARLVHGPLYDSIAKEGSCTLCGGYFGVLDGTPSCHFCGARPSGHVTEPAAESSSD